jgi:hypothetical protein
MAYKSKEASHSGRGYYLIYFDQEAEGWHCLDVVEADAVYGYSFVSRTF